MNKIEDAIRLALDEANRKMDSSLLFHPEDLDSKATWDEGDPETLYSIAAMYADDENNDGTWTDEITDALEKEFPAFSW